MKIQLPTKSACIHIAACCLIFTLISCSDDDEVAQENYEKRWELDLSSSLGFSVSGSTLPIILLDNESLAVVAYATDKSYIVEIDVEGNYLHHEEFDAYIVDLRKIDNGSVLVAIDDYKASEYTFGSYKDRTFDIIKTLPYSAFGDLDIISLRLTSDGLLVHEANLLSPDPTTITKYDMEGSFQWKTTPDESGAIRVGYLVNVYENNFYGVGTPQSSDIGPTYVWSIDMEGNIIWNKDFPIYHRVRFVLENEHKEIFLVGDKQDVSAGIVEKYDRITNSSSSLIWQTNVSAELKIARPPRGGGYPLATSDGGILINLIEDYQSGYRSHIVKLNHKGAIVWHLKQREDQDQLTFLELEDHSIVVNSTFGVIYKYSN